MSSRNRVLGRDFRGPLFLLKLKVIGSKFAYLSFCYFHPQRLKLILVFSDYHENIIIIRRLNLKPQYPELIMVYQFPPSQSFILFSGSRTKTFVFDKKRSINSAQP